PVAVHLCGHHPDAGANPRIRSNPYTISLDATLGMTWRTVKQFADAATPEEPFTCQWQNRPSVLDYYKPYLDDRWNEGCTNAWKLWEEIVPLG
ncbi:hypothetical protein ACIREI_44630, partial [Streptomyces sp. NPDC093591]